MSWNNGNGPGRTPGQGPWGQGPQNTPPNDVEDAIRRVQESIKRMGFGGGGGGSGGAGGGIGGFGAKGLLLFALAAIAIWLGLGSFYTVQPNEIGINLVLGKYTGKVPSGLNMNWPWPIGSHVVLPVWDQQITTVGYEGQQGAGDIAVESQMLTGDENIIDLHFRVIWQIDQDRPEDYVFHILNPRDTVKAVAESVMREVVGLKTIDGILTADRKSIEPDALKRMQTVLSSYGAGVIVKQVQLQSVDAPPQVISAYRDVTAAQQDLQRLVNEADTYANKVVPEAKGAASRIFAEANAYKQQTIFEAQGQTARYAQIYEQYKKAPAVTRERMYLETMERVLGGMAKTIVDTGAANAPVTYLPLDALTGKGAAK